MREKCRRQAKYVRTGHRFDLCLLAVVGRTDRNFPTRDIAKCDSVDLEAASRIEAEYIKHVDSNNRQI